MADPLLSERDLIAIAKAAEAEQRYPDCLRVPAWQAVEAVLATSKSPRTKLMAARMIVDRTDPIVEPEKAVQAQIINVAVILEQPAGTNGHALPGVKIELEERNGDS